MLSTLEAWKLVGGTAGASLRLPEGLSPRFCGLCIVLRLEGAWGALPQAVSPKRCVSILPKSMA